jgi:hypothetical protein
MEERGEIMVEIKNRHYTNTDKWKLDVVDWLEGKWRENLSRGSEEKIIIPCNMIDKNYKSVPIIKIDLSINCCSTKRQIEGYKTRGIDLTGVPHISLEFKDNVKRVNKSFKEYMMYRIWGDLEDNFTKDEIPFYHTNNFSHIRIYNTDMINSNGKRIDKKEVK